MDNEFDAKTLRDDRAKRAARMIEPGDPRKKVDASSWTPPESMQTGKQVQPKRPADPLFRAAGGKTVARADRKPRCGGGMMRASGGKADGVKTGAAEDEALWKPHSSPESDRTMKAMRDYHAAHELAHAAWKAKSPDLPELKQKRADARKAFTEAHQAEYESRNPDLAPKRSPGFANGGATNPVPVSRMSFGQRASTPLPGTTSAMKKGGAANSDEKQDRALVKKMVKPEARTGKANGGHPKGCSCASCSGGRVERASGGRTKGKTNIVIAVNPNRGDAPSQPAAAPQAMQPHPAMPLPTAPPPMAPPQGLMPAGGPPPGAMPPVGMPRKRGGRAYYDLEGGAGSGLGRLEKANRA